MFTGLVDDIGTIERVGETDAGLEFVVRCRYTDLAPGESVAMNGVCLTVRERGPHWFAVAAMTTTLGATTLGQWKAGDRLNLERALRAGDRLGGHVVQGHVDGVGVVAETRTEESAWIVEVVVPDELFESLVPRGSVALDGVSLTVSGLPREAALQVSLIEYTRRHTTLGALCAGSRINVETDVIGKYVRRLAAPYTRAHA